MVSIDTSYKVLESEGLKVTDIKAFTVHGEFPFEGKQYREERFIQPIDIYPEYAKMGPRSTKKMASTTMEVSKSFLEIKTETDITGISPIEPLHWEIIKVGLKDLLMGKSVLAREMMWNQMYRVQSARGRRGQTMIAISSIDNCLWDIIGKYRKEPVYRLLGGPVKDKIRVYASMIGHCLEPGLATERAQQMVKQGYTALKWHVRYGPSDGLQGEKKNLELVKTVRDAVGYDVDLMIDCWQSWNVPYTIKMAKKMERYELGWIEEPLMPDQIMEGYPKVKAAVDIPISGGEHEYTRWTFAEFLKWKILDIWQPDCGYAGGISEVTKICTLASIDGIPVIPHTNKFSNAHIWFSQNVATCPIAEFMVKSSPVDQFFYKNPLTPVKGYINAPVEQGLGIELDKNKILEKRYLSNEKAGNSLPSFLF